MTLRRPTHGPSTLAATWFLCTLFLGSMQAHADDPTDGLGIAIEAAGGFESSRAIEGAGGLEALRHVLQPPLASDALERSTLVQWWPAVLHHTRHVIIGHEQGGPTE